MTTDDLLAARYPQVPIGRGHYESTYLKASHPDEPLGIWIRFTIRKVPGRPPIGSIWCTLFEPGGPTAVKVSSEAVAASATTAISIGDYGQLSEHGTSGTVSASNINAEWDIRFVCAEQPLKHLSSDWMYRAPLPRTKSSSPKPDMRLAGSIVIDGRQISVDGWRAMLGHNWGTEHAHRWIWLQASGFADHPETWLDVVLGRLRVGPITTPWIASGVISHNGVRHRVGGPGRIHRTEVGEFATGNDIVLPGSDLTAAVHVEAPRERFVVWRYANPSGGEHQVRNCSIAALTLELATAQSAPVELGTPFGATYEIGTAEFDDALPMQPFPDQ